MPNFYRNLQFDFKYLICVAVCVQIMQIARIGVPWEAEVLWSEFHPKHPPYIWKSMRKSWRKCFEEKLCLGTPRFSDLNFILAGIFYSHLSVHEENYVHFKVHEGNYVHGENLKEFFFKKTLLRGSVIRISSLPVSSTRISMILSWGDTDQWPLGSLQNKLSL